MNTSAPACWWQYVRARFFGDEGAVERLIDIYLDNAPNVSQRAETYLRKLRKPALQALWSRWQVANIPRHETDLWQLIIKIRGIRS